MTTARLLTCLAVSAALAACERGAPEADDKSIKVPSGDYQARLQALPEGQRNAVFIRALRDARRPCQAVEGSAPAGDINGAPAWTAVCEDGVHWVIVIGANGVAQITNAAELQAAAGAAKTS